MYAGLNEFVCCRTLKLVCSALWLVSIVEEDKKPIVDLLPILSQTMPSTTVETVSNLRAIVVVCDYSEL